MRAVWRGAISLGLVTIPVRLLTAVRKQDVRFRELDRRTGARVRHERVSEPAVFDWTPVPPRPAGGAREAPAEPPPRPVEAEARVDRADLVRGYEIEPGRYVQITEEDLAAVAPEKSRTIDVEQFVDRGDLDSLYFETAYYVVPDLDYARPFAILLRALQQTNRAGICWIVLRSRRHLAALQPRGDLMLLTTLLFADEVVGAESVAPILPKDLGEREVDMAELLVNTLTGPFEPQRYRDEYRERLRELIQSRAEGGEVIEPSVPPAPAANVEDLMAALTASVEAAKARRAEQEGSAPQRRRRRA